MYMKLLSVTYSIHVFKEFTDTLVPFSLILTGLQNSLTYLLTQFFQRFDFECQKSVQPVCYLITRIKMIRNMQVHTNKTLECGNCFFLFHFSVIGGPCYYTNECTQYDDNSNCIIGLCSCVEGYYETDVFCAARGKVTC